MSPIDKTIMEDMQRYNHTSAFCYSILFRDREKSDGFSNNCL